MNDALFADEGLRNILPAGRSELVGTVSEDGAVSILEVAGDVVEHIADLVADHTAAVAGHLHRVLVEEPVDHVDVVAILFDQDVAGVLAVEEPVADELFGFVVALGDGGSAAEPGGADHLDGSEFAGRVDGAGSLIILAVTLLEIHADALGGVGLPGSGLEAADTGGVNTGGLFAEDVLAGFDGGFEMLGVQERGRGDEHGVHIGGEQVVEILVGFGAGVLGSGLVELVLIDVTEGGDAKVFVLGEESTDVHAAVAAADQAEGERGVGLGSANDLGCGEEQRRLGEFTTGGIAHNGLSVHPFR